MANEVMLEVYSFRIREIGNKKSDKAMDSFYKGNDFIDFLEKYLKNEFKFMVVHKGLKKKFTVPIKDFSKDKSGRRISGTLKCGEYGTASDIVDETGKIKYKKGVNDSDMKPFYFMFYVPKKINVAFLALQKTGAHSVNKLFSGHVATKFTENYPELMIDSGTYIAKELANKFANEGLVKEIVLRQSELPANLEDKFNMTSLGEVFKNMEIRFTTKPFTSASAKKYLKGKDAAFFDIPVELQAMGIKGEYETSIKLDINGTERTIDMSHTGKIRPYFNIDDKVAKTIEGHPTFDSIDLEAKKLVNDLTKKFVL